MSEKVKKDVAQAHNKRGDKVENDNEWKIMSTKNKKYAKKSNNRRNELEEKGSVNMNRFSRLKEMLEDDKETHEATSEAATQDENRKKNQIKNIEKQKEPHHMDNVKMGDLDKTINAFLAEDEMKPSDRNVVKNHSDRSKEEIKSVQKQKNKIVVKDCDETHEDSDEESQDYSFYEDSDGDDISTCYGISEDEEEHEEWMKRKMKCKERSNSE